MIVLSERVRRDVIAHPNWPRPLDTKVLTDEFLRAGITVIPDSPEKESIIEPWVKLATLPDIPWHLDRVTEVSGNRLSVSCRLSNPISDRSHMRIHYQLTYFRLIQREVTVSIALPYPPRRLPMSWIKEFYQVVTFPDSCQHEVVPVLFHPDEFDALCRSLQVQLDNLIRPQ